MAGDWIKFEVSTPEKQEVLAITVEMGWDDPDLTVGKLLRVWRWFDQQTMDGNARGVSAALLDRIVSVSGFAQAMANVGWLVIDSSGVSLPNFGRHNGATAKSRALTAKRVANHKSNGKGNADGNEEGNAASVTGALPREEKRRIEESTEAKASAADAAPDPKSTIWTLGVQLLKTAGNTESAARSFLGKHAQADESKLAQVIGHLAANPKIEPKAYIAAAMAPEKPELAF